MGEPGAAGTKISGASRAARLRVTARAAAFLAAFLSLAALAGWIFGIRILMQVLPGRIAMVPSTAIGLLLAAIALWLEAGGRTRTAGASRILAAAVGLLGLAGLAEYATGASLGTDGILYREGAGVTPEFPGRMAVITAVAFVGLSGALLAAAARRAIWTADVLALVPGLLGLFSLTGYAYGARGLYWMGISKAMAVHTAAALLLLAIGVLLSRGERGGVSALICSETAGGEVVRRVIPVALVVPLLLGRLEISAERARVLTGNMQDALTAVGNAATLLVIFVAVAWQLHRSDERRRRSEEALSRSEQNVRLLLDSTAEAIYGLDTSGNCTFCNPAAVRLLGYGGPGDLLGRNMHTLAHHTRRDGSPYPVEECPVVGAFRTGEGVHVEDEVLWRADGTSFAAEYWSYPVRRGGEVVGSVMTFLDVSERKRAEEAVRKLSRAVEQADNAIFITDPEGVIHYVNPAFERIYDLPKEEALGRTPRILKSGRQDPEFYARFWTRLLSGESVRAEFVNRRSDGALVTVEAVVSPLFDGKGQRIGFVAVQNDITDRKRAEEALSRSEKRFSLAFHANPIPTCIAEYRTARILDMNAEFVRALGYAREELIGRTAMQVGLWTDESDRERIVGELVETGVVRNREVTLRTRSGEVRTAVASVVRIDVGSMPCVLTTFVDVTERNRAAEELRGSEERLRSILDTAHDAFVGMDSDGRIVEWNPEAEKIFGWTQEEAAGRLVSELIIPPRLREDDQRGLARFLATGEGSALNQRIEIPAVNRAGREFPVELTISPMRLRDRFLFSAFLHDVTERKSGEEALRASEERYRLLFESNPQTMWVFDVETLAFLAVNDAACGHYGFTRQEFLGMTIRDIRPAEEVPALIDHLATEGPGYQRSGVFRHQRKSGHVIEVEIASHPLTFDGRAAQLVLATDVTERRRAEKELRRSEERYRLLFERNLAGVFRSTLDGRVLDCNDALARIYGYDSREEMLARPATDLYADPSVREQLVDAIRSEQELVGHEEEGRRKDGSRIWLLGNYTLVPDAAGEPTILEGTVIDITDRKQLQEQLQQAQKMEAVGRLAGGIAHDFNNILTTVLGYSNLALGGLAPGDPLSEDILEIQKAGERAAELTRQLLAFSRKQILEPRVLDLNATIGGMERMLRRLIGEDIRLVVRGDPDLGAVRADAGQIEQVVMNLAVNSRDAMPGGGELTIETRNVELDEDYVRGHADLMPPGRYVLLAVSDTGVGMDDSVRARIFEPFFTTKEPGKGTGLGLATVYGIVKQSGGYVWCYSEPGVGTAFKIYLPRLDEKARVLAPAATSGTSASGSETILLVEDEEALENLTRKLLTTNGYRVLSARSASEALQIAGNGPPIQLLLTDVIMPGQSGRELAEKLQARLPDLKVVFMSGYTDDSIVRHGILEPGVAFLQKPFTPQALARKVREALDGAR